MFRVSCIQLRSNNDIKYNLAQTNKLIIKAVKQKTDFIITPEVSSHFSLNKKELLNNCRSALLKIFLLGFFLSIEIGTTLVLKLEIFSSSELINLAISNPFFWTPTKNISLSFKLISTI